MCVNFLARHGPILHCMEHVTRNQFLMAADVARRLGIAPATVRGMDDVLQPVRARNGTRLYDAELVERVAKAREAARAEQEAPK